MTIDDTTRAAAIEALRDDRATYDMPDGRTLRLCITPDEGFDPFAELDTYGRVAWVDDRGYRQGRPDGFDGNAEKLQAGRSEQVWWQPPADGPKRGAEGWRELRSLVSDLLEFGCSVVTVELLEGEDAYRRPIVRDAASVGGVEPMSYGSEYLSELVSDLLAELDAQ